MILPVGTKVSVAPRNGVQGPDLVGSATIVDYERTENKGKVYYVVEFRLSKQRTVVKRKYVRAEDSLKHPGEKWWEQRQEPQDPKRSNVVSERQDEEEEDDQGSGDDDKEEEFSPVRTQVLSRKLNASGSKDEGRKGSGIITGSENTPLGGLIDGQTSSPLASNKKAKLSTGVADESDFESDAETSKRSSAEAKLKGEKSRSSGTSPSAVDASRTPLATSVISSQSSVPSTESSTSLPSKSSTPSSSSSSSQVKESSTTATSASMYEGLKPLQFPSGVAGAIGEFMLDRNRPLSLVAVVQKFKETYTRAQIEKALNVLVEKKFVETLDEGAKIFWINQRLVEDMYQGSVKVDAAKVTDWCNNMSEVISTLDAKRMDAENRVRVLITAPSDEELEKQLDQDRAKVAELNTRVQECEEVAKEAERRGQSAAVLHASTVAELRSEVAFYRGHWSSRKKQLTEFLDKVCDAKNLKGSGRRELLEKIGIETDEDAKVSLIKGAKS